MRLIDADDLLEQFCEENENIPPLWDAEDGEYWDGGFSTCHARFLIKSAKTVDAVPVVRCKDCAYHDRDDYSFFYDAYWCGYHEGYMASDDFCSHADKKGGS